MDKPPALVSPGYEPDRERSGRVKALIFSGFGANVFIFMFTNLVSWLGGPVFLYGQFLLTASISFWLVNQFRQRAVSDGKIINRTVFVWFGLMIGLFFAGDTIETKRLQAEYMKDYKASIGLPVPAGCQVGLPWRAMPYNEFTCDISVDQLKAELRQITGGMWREGRGTCKGVAFMSGCTTLTSPNQATEFNIFVRDGKASFNFWPR